MPDLLIHFDETTGEFHIEAEGFEGLSCLEGTQIAEEALGEVKESDRAFKPESHQTRQRIASHPQVQQNRRLTQ
ncbi:MAG: DUF2997 domain-containing protein [Microcystaceae cyanobacterium]